MRSNLELWEIVRDNFDRFFIRGLCYTMFRLYIYKKIDANEFCKLYFELKNHGDTSIYFLGKRGDAEPRKEFIEKMIKKHKNIL